MMKALFNELGLQLLIFFIYLKELSFKYRSFYSVIISNVPTQNIAINPFLIMTDLFTINVPCKPYVKAYLENNCGTPVNLKLLPELLQEFRARLNKKPSCQISGNRYADSVTIIIPPDWFYRYGWELNRESIKDLNKLVEHKVKFIMSQYVALNNSLGISIAICIREFQERFDFPEHVWAYESIKKDFYRNGQKSQFKMIKQLKSEIRSNFLKEMVKMGIITKNIQKLDIHVIPGKNIALV
jgi:hypothetical protein